MSLSSHSAAAALRASPSRQEKGKDKQVYFDLNHYDSQEPYDDHFELERIQETPLLVPSTKPCPPRRALPALLLITVLTAVSFAAACVYFQTFTTLFLYLSVLIVTFPLLVAFQHFGKRRLTNDVNSIPSPICSLLVRFKYLLAIIWFAAIVESLFFAPVLDPSDASVASAAQPAKSSHFKLFIASNLYNSETILPGYTKSLKEFIQLIGPDNVYVSIYESHSKDNTRALLRQFDQDLWKMNVARRILSDDRAIRHDITSDGNDRIEFLSTVRNIAMEPLSSNSTADSPFTHVLWINDIIFDAKDAYNLLRTNEGRYDQVCAIDYIGNGFYDTWVTRDIDDGTLKRNWPYFGRQDDIAALRAAQPFLVNSCWNGMTAFAAKWFTETSPPASQQNASENDSALVKPPHKQEPPVSLPIRFRASPMCFSSECLLTSYDIHRAASPARPRIYINPAVQVAYRRAHYFMYNVLIPSPITRVWRKVWRDWISFRLFGWLTESRRWANDCRQVLTEWAAPDARLVN